MASIIFLSSPCLTHAIRYGGGGLYRHQYLVHTSASAFLPPDRSWVHANLTNAKIKSNGPLPAEGASATGVEVVSEVEVRNAHATQLDNVWITTETFPDSVSASAGPFTLAPGSSQSVRLSMSPPDAVQLWSVARPFLYTAVVSVRVGGATGAVVDAVNVTFGARDIRLDADHGMFINGRHVKMRGYDGLDDDILLVDPLTHSLTHSLARFVLAQVLRSLEFWRSRLCSS